jgi:hypothetical protein
VGRPSRGLAARTGSLRASAAPPEPDRRLDPAPSAPAAPISQVSSALERLKAIKEGGGKRLDHFEVKEEAAVYDVVDEKEYAQIVAKRRAEGGGFVVDDEGLGYGDDGEDDDLVMPDADREEGAEQGRGGKRKDAAKGKGARRGGGGGVPLACALRCPWAAAANAGSPLLSPVRLRRRRLAPAPGALPAPVNHAPTHLTAPSDSPAPGPCPADGPGKKPKAEPARDPAAKERMQRMFAAAAQSRQAAVAAKGARPCARCAR